MEKQSGGEFASTDAAAGAQDAALQELWLSAEIPVEPCSRLQHLQRPTPSHLGSDTPDATRRGDENMARGRRSDVRIPVANGSTTLASPQRDNTRSSISYAPRSPAFWLLPIIERSALQCGTAVIPRHRVRACRLTVSRQRMVASRGRLNDRRFS